MVDEQPEPDLPLQQRRAESADPVDFAVGEQRARRLGRRCSSRSSGRVDRLTLQGALRFDRARSWFPEQQEGPSRFLPTPIVIPETRGVDSYKDITPRMGVAYDLFGNGRTALKMSLGKYLEGAGVIGQLRQHQPHAADAADDVDVWHRGRDAGVDRRQPEFRARLRSARIPPRRICGPAAAICAA